MKTKTAALILLLCVILWGCMDKSQITYEGDEDGHYCSVKPNHPMPGATYCEWNYTRGYSAGLQWVRENEMVNITYEFSDDIIWNSSDGSQCFKKDNWIYFKDINGAIYGIISKEQMERLYEN